MIDFGFGVQLGPIRRADSAVYYAWRNDPDIYRWCRQYEPLDGWTHDNWINGLGSRSDVKMYAIYDETRPLGVCGLTGLDLVNRRAEFSLYVGQEHWGNGYGLTGLKTLCAHGFMALGLHHIFGETFQGNPAIKTFEKVGFKKEGTRRGFYYRQGKFIDAHIYSILNEEFIAKWKPSLRA